jgi:hypothetical protein
MKRSSPKNVPHAISVEKSKKRRMSYIQSLNERIQSQDDEIKKLRGIYKDNRHNRGFCMTCQNTASNDAPLLYCCRIAAESDTLLPSICGDCLLPCINPPSEVLHHAEIHTFPVSEPAKVNRCMHGSDIKLDVIREINCTNLVNRLDAFFNEKPVVSPKMKPCKYCGLGDLDELTCIPHYFSCILAPPNAFALKCPKCNDEIFYKELRSHIESHCTAFRCRICKKKPGGSTSTNMCMTAHVTNEENKALFMKYSMHSYIHYLERSAAIK